MNMNMLMQQAQKMQKEMEKAQKEMKKTKAIIQSMTPYERKHPEVLKASRKIRIAKGSAMQVSDVNNVLKKYEKSKELMKQMKNNPGGRFF